MANFDVDLRTMTRRRPVATLRTQREPSFLAGFSVDRPPPCRLSSGQMLRSACLLLLCLGFSYLPKVEKAPPQASVVEAANAKS